MAFLYVVTLAMLMPLALRLYKMHQDALIP
jgi:hypothetical protein